ncbi:glycoside hydrolase superfamily [Obelidium mucronatum]|nr:glycoside hydrolase superfamily [Obelidium mucronatum]
MKQDPTQPEATANSKFSRKQIFIAVAALALVIIGVIVGTVVGLKNKANDNSSPTSTSFEYRPFTTPGVIGYWANWGEDNQPENTIDKLDLSGFTAVKYSFVFPTADGRLIPSWTYTSKNGSSRPVITDSSAADAKWIPILNKQVRNKYPSLRTVISIGGWTGSTNFSSISASEKYTNAFAKNVRTFVDTNGFDGVDLDWEYPGGGGIDCLESNESDISNFVSLLSALRAELGPTRHLSIAAGDASRYTAANGKNYLKDYAKFVNYFGLMTYDIHGSWNAFSDFNSPLRASSDSQSDTTLVDPNSPISIETFVENWTSNLIPKSQIVTGLAFYGRAMSVVSQGPHNGLFQPCQSQSNALNTDITTATPCPPVYGDYLDALVSCDTCGICGVLSGQWMYYSIRGAFGKQDQAPLSMKNSFKDPVPMWTREYFGFAESATVFTPAYRNYTNYFIAYDDPVSIKAKSRWAKAVAGLGGQMIWELSSDYNGELAAAAVDGWNGK